MLFTNISEMISASLIRKRKNSRKSWIFWWLCPTVIALLVDLGWPSTLLYALIGIAQRRAPEPSSYDARHSQCEIIGNPDFYGLGIRLGIYFQWFSALLAGSVEGQGLLVSYFVFALALYVTFFVFTFGNSCTFIAEVAIMLLIFFGGIYIMLISRFYRRRKTPNVKANSSIGLTIAFDLLLFPMVLYGCWFWCRMAGGRVKPFADSPCGTTLFLFARVTPQRIRMASGFMAFVFIYTLLAVCFYQLSQIILYFGPMLTLWLNRKTIELPVQSSSRAPSIAGSQHSIPPSLQRILQVGAQFDPADAVFFRQCAFWMVYVIPYGLFLLLLHGALWLILRATGQNKKPWAENFLKEDPEDGTRGPFASVVIVLYVSVAIVLSILGVELTLLWNSISGVYDVKNPGQLIPLIIGMGIFGQVLWKKLTIGSEAFMRRVVGQSPETVNHSAEHELKDIAEEMAINIEAGISFQLPNSRWMSFSSHLPHTSPEPAP